jgi:hypothetical protein
MAAYMPIQVAPLSLHLSLSLQPPPPSLSLSLSVCVCVCVCVCVYVWFALCPVSLSIMHRPVIFERSLQSVLMVLYLITFLLQGARMPLRPSWPLTSGPTITCLSHPTLEVCPTQRPYSSAVLVHSRTQLHETGAKDCRKHLTDPPRT